MKAFKFTIYEWNDMEGVFNPLPARYFETLEVAKQSVIEHLITTGESHILEWAFDPRSNEHSMKLNSYQYYIEEITIEK